MLSKIYRIDIDKYTRVITDNSIIENKIDFARDICRREKVKYMIKNEALFILDPYTRHYVQICFNILNLTFEFLEKIIYRFCEMYYY